MTFFNDLVEAISKQTSPRYRGDELYGLYRLCLGLHEGRVEAAKTELLNFMQGADAANLMHYSQALVDGRRAASTKASGRSNEKHVSRRVCWTRPPPLATPIWTSPPQSNYRLRRDYDWLPEKLSMPFIRIFRYAIRLYLSGSFGSRLASGVSDERSPTTSWRFRCSVRCDSFRSLSLMSSPKTP